MKIPVSKFGMYIDEYFVEYTKDFKISVNGSARFKTITEKFSTLQEAQDFYKTLKYCPTTKIYSVPHLVSAPLVDYELTLV